MSHSPFPCRVALRVIGVIILIIFKYSDWAIAFFLKVLIKVLHVEHSLKELLIYLNDGGCSTGTYRVTLNLMSPEKVRSYWK